MAKATHSVTMIVRLAVDVKVGDETLEDAMETAKSLKLSDLVKLTGGVSLNDVELETVSVQSSKWL
jgi:hypothetical protein